MTILQSYAQGVSVWGEEGMEALWSASAVLMYGGGVRDDRMLHKLEALIGDYEESTRSVSRSADGRSTSDSVREKKILTVAELASLQAGRALVFASKPRPIVAQLEPWWERSWPREIRERLGAQPAPVVEEDRRLRSRRLSRCTSLLTGSWSPRIPRRRCAPMTFGGRAGGGRIRRRCCGCRRCE